MGRRDEPKLDELKRLLRRLETIEVDPKTEGSAKAASAPSPPSSGYVGALRGAAPIESVEKRRRAPPRRAGMGHAPDKFNRPGNSTTESSSSTASIVIGATTAAVVSSIVVVGLLLWSGGGQGERKAAQQRMTFVAPTEPAAPAVPAAEPAFVPPQPASEPAAPASEPVAPAAQPAVDEAPPSDAQSLLERADLKIRSGDLAEARELLEQAAKLGSGVAALTLGAMYDPARVAEFGNLGVRADPTLARAWYERAKALGVVEATDRLSELARK
jgi:hypothetical protein